MHSIYFRINAVEQILKDCKSGWALNYWNTVLRELHEMREKTTDDFEQELAGQVKKSIVFD